MGKAIANFDWAKTSLGDSDEWPSELMVILSLVLNNIHPMCIIWGKDFLQLYNDAFI